MLHVLKVLSTMQRLHWRPIDLMPSRNLEDYILTRHAPEFVDDHIDVLHMNVLEHVRRHNSVDALVKKGKRLGGGCLEARVRTAAAEAPRFDSERHGSWCDVDADGCEAALPKHLHSTSVATTDIEDAIDGVASDVLHE